MDEFNQQQAGLLSGYEDREFRSLVDKRIILPSPATRHFGRGKAKTFMRAEVRVATILRQLDFGLSPFQQAGITDWIRQHLADVAFRSSADHPYYILLELGGGEGWKGKFEQAWGDRHTDHSKPNHPLVENDARKISVMINDDGTSRPMHRIIGANVTTALWWDDDEKLASIFSEPTDVVDAEQAAE